LRSINWEKAQTAEINRGTDHLVKEETRISQVIWQDLLTPIGCVLKNYLLQANSIWNYDLSYLEQAQIAKYGLGGHYDWHIDSFVPNEAKQQRKLTAVAFLSDPDSYKGGEFELKVAPDLPKKLPQGTLLIFPSVLEHRVTAVKSGERYTASCWAFGPAFK
jgi:predicted 2-oxoglutarate/Fe(II)-dependent dioxygenase YbiX